MSVCYVHSLSEEREIEHFVQRAQTLCKILVGDSTDLRTAELNFKWAGCVSESEGSEKVSGLNWPNIKHIDPETDMLFILVLISAEI